MTQITGTQVKKKSKTGEKKNYSKIEIYSEDATEALENFYRNIVHVVGEDSKREGLVRTPLRAAKAIQFLTQGYEMNPEEILKSAMFKEKYSEMVIVKDIEMYSLCE